MPKLSRQIVPQHIADLAPYVPGKSVQALEKELGIKHAIKLASNENPLGPSPNVHIAVENVLGEMHRYPDSQASILKEALGEALGVAPAMLVLGCGSNELIDIVIRTFCDPASDDEVIIGNPSFVYYRIGIGAAKVRLHEVALRDHLRWSVDDLLASVRPSSRMMVIANPNNPTGAYLDGASLRRLVTELPERVLLVVDEAYVEYCDETCQSALAFRDRRKNLIVLRTFSKAYGLAGYRIGFAIAPRELADYMQRVRLPFNVSHVAQVAALAALGDHAHLNRVVTLNRRERDRVTQHLTAMGFGVEPSQANFVLIGPVSLCKPEVGAKQLYEALLRKGIIVRPVPEPIGDYLRVSIGTERENALFLDALKGI